MVFAIVLDQVSYHIFFRSLIGEFKFFEILIGEDLFYSRANKMDVEHFIFDLEKRY